MREVMPIVIAHSFQKIKAEAHRMFPLSVWAQVHVCEDGPSSVRSDGAESLWCFYSKFKIDILPRWMFRPLILVEILLALRRTNQALVNEELDLLCRLMLLCFSSHFHWVHSYDRLPLLRCWWDWILHFDGRSIILLLLFNLPWFLYFHLLECFCRCQHLWWCSTLRSSEHGTPFCSRLAKANSRLLSNADMGIKNFF